MNYLMKQYQWNAFYNKVKSYYSVYINNQNCLENSKLRGDTHTIIHRFHGNDIPNWIREEFKSDILIVQIFAAEPRSVGLIHKDGTDRQCAFNIPLFGCESGYMQWFEESQLTTRLISNEYTSIRISEEQIQNGKSFEPIPIQSTLIVHPTLINTNIWHRIDNRDSDQFRWMISIRFAHNPSFQVLSEEII